MMLTRGSLARVRLLVSVMRADEVPAALAGGADVVDAKDPGRGALGAVSPATLRAIVETAAGAAPVSAAIGDPADERAAERAARSAAAAGASWVKLGCLGDPADERRVRALIVAAARGAGEFSARVVATAYADAARVGGAAPAVVARAAAAAGAAGVLLDTAVKDGATLRSILAADAVREWAAAARAAGLLVALAGSLDESGVAWAGELGADIVGVRGAACDGGRGGRVSAARVRRLAAAVHTPGGGADSRPAAPPAPARA